MADTIRTISALQTLLADNATGDISPQDLRDMLVSLANAYQQLYTDAEDYKQYPLISRGTANDAGNSAFITNMSLPVFPDAATKERFAEIIIPRAYTDGETVNIVLNWAVNSVNTGVVRWGVEYTLAQGHNQGVNSAFPATTTINEEVNISVASQYRHFTTEFSTAIPATILEPDAAILCRIFREGAHANDTFAADAHAVSVGLNHKRRYLAAKNKTPDHRA